MGKRDIQTVDTAGNERSWPSRCRLCSPKWRSISWDRRISSIHAFCLLCNPRITDVLITISDDPKVIFLPTPRSGVISKCRGLSQSMKIGYVTDDFGTKVWDAMSPIAGIVL